MTSDHGIKNSAQSFRQNQEYDFAAGSSRTCYDLPAMGKEWKMNRFSCRSYLIGRAYDEPPPCCTVENILLGRMYIID